MQRRRASDLDQWLAARARKPLVLRGARQVGKTWLVRDLAARKNLDLLEVNFERDPGLGRAFRATDPSTVLSDLSLALGRDIEPERSLLFLDEIQSAPDVFAKLRWFAEELPALPVVAAGSLLEFTLRNPPHGVPVGRIGFMHVEPMGFDEYLDAHRQSSLVSKLVEWRPGQRFSEMLHERALEWFRRYLMVGGMPEVVAMDAGGAPARACRELQRDLVATYRADFARYAGRMDQGILEAVLAAVGRSLGQKFVYARVSEGVKQHQSKRALELLAAARLCHLVRHSAANGLPLGGEVKDSFRRAIYLDIGIFHALGGTPAAARFPSWNDIAPQVRAQLADQIAGQALRLNDAFTGDGPALFYWQREGGRPGEIDYLVQAASRIVPVELKSGSSGSMKSLHQFMFDKRLELAVRLDENPPSDAQIAVKTTQGDPVRYRLLSLPTYLAFRLADVVERALER
jgi:predicted AAA+ superfamily ATPase